MGVSANLSHDTIKTALADQQGSNNGENREEGEIVDDFEDIISSDEELTMRKRIEELEAKNTELEKLANISGYYDNYADVGIASDRYKPGKILKEKLHNGEYSMPTSSQYPKQAAKRAAISSLRHGQHYTSHNDLLFTSSRKHDYNPPDTVDYPVQRHPIGNRKRRYEKSKRIRSMHKKNRSKSRKRARLDLSMSSDEEQLYALDRSKLRRALRHEPIAVNTERNLVSAIKESSSIIRGLADRPEVIELNDTTDKAGESDDSESLEIQELRLIALKSAFLRKDRQRKQRKEIEQKKPYSPTDCLQPIIRVDSEIASPQYFPDIEPCNSMDISPISSPECVGDGCILKPVDMDLVDSSDSSSPEFIESQSNWMPIHPINEIPLPRSPQYHAAYQVSSSDTSQIILSPIPIRASASTVPTSMRSIQSTITIETDDDEKVEIVSEGNESPEPEDEEVLALRALLLAQKNSPKFSKAVKSVNKSNVPKPVTKTPDPVEPVQPADPLKAILKITQGPPSKTQEILKEAVKRLQNKSNPNEELGGTENAETIPSVGFPTEPPQTSNSRFPNDKDYRLISACTNALPTVEATLRPVEAAIRIPDASPIIYQSVPPAKTAKVKENIYISSGKRPNNIQIVPTKTLQRPIRKSPLTDITETGNVEVNTKPKITEPPAQLESSAANAVRGDNVAPSANQTGTSMLKASNARKALPTPASKVRMAVAIVSQTPIVKAVAKTVPNLVAKSATIEPQPEKISPITYKASPIEMKRQRKRSLTALETLQMKTQSLIANGRFVSRNKVVAAKILNKAINHNVSTTAKRKIVAKVKSLEDARLVKTVTLPAVKPLVINLGAKSDSDSDDCYYADKEIKRQDVHGDDFYDVASPISLPMESPRDSPLTITAVITPVLNIVAVNKINEMEVENVASVETKKEGTFEAKLEEFLKEARSKVDISKKDVSRQPPPVKKATADKQQKLSINSAAVRHLPPSAQLEYRRLINRMQLLEKRKTTKPDTEVLAKENTIKIINNKAPSPVVLAKLNSTSSSVKQTQTPIPSIISILATAETENTVDNTKDDSFSLENSSIMKTLQNHNIVTSTPKSEYIEIKKNEEISKDTISLKDVAMPSVGVDQNVIPMVKAALTTTKNVTKIAKVCQALVTNTAVNVAKAEATTKAVGASQAVIATKAASVSQAVKASKVASASQAAGVSNAVVASKAPGASNTVVASKAAGANQAASASQAAGASNAVVASNATGARQTVVASKVNKAVAIKTVEASKAAKTISAVEGTKFVATADAARGAKPAVPIVGESSPLPAVAFISAPTLTSAPASISTPLSIPTTASTSTQAAISTASSKPLVASSSLVTSTVVVASKCLPTQKSNLITRKISNIKPKTKATLTKTATPKLKASVKTIATKKLKITSTANLVKPKIGPNKNRDTNKLPELNEMQTSLDCERQYKESSCNLLENIRKTIQLVNAAQKEKNEKLMLEQELLHLRKKILETETKIKEKNSSMALIFPKISSSHKLIVALKDRTTNLDQLSIDLSKRQGDKRNNSFYVEQKTKIKRLSKELSLEIKRLKEMKVSNVENAGLASTSGAKQFMIDKGTQVVSIKNTSPAKQCSNIPVVSQQSNSINSTLVSGNLNKIDSNSSSSKLLSPHLSTSNNELSEKVQKPEGCTLAECDIQNVQSSLDSSIMNVAEGDANCNKEDVNRGSERFVKNVDGRPEKNLYYKIWDAGDMESDGTGQKSVGHKNMYVSPLEFASDSNGSINPNGILCPYQLMGQCDDKECKYEHLKA